MKVALIRQRFTRYGGAERYVGRLAEELILRGIEVHILARRWDSDDSVDLHFHKIKSSGGPTFIRQPSFARHVARVVGRESFDLVHSFDRTYSQDVYRAGDGCHIEFLERRARMEGGRRRTTDRLNPRHRAFLRLEARLFSDPRLKLVLANSRQGKDEIIRHYGVRKDRIRVIYNGLDRTRFFPELRDQYRDEVRHELDLEADDPMILYVGSGYRRKGLGELVKALAGFDGRLVVAGKDDPRPFKQEAVKLGVDKRIIWLGAQQKVERLYGAADVFVLPSWYEPFFKRLSGSHGRRAGRGDHPGNRCGRGN
jgi:UDP-glucose:(heptosyl)LPS alpha-1,3-glucosyltransferase